MAFGSFQASAGLFSGWFRLRAEIKRDDDAAGRRRVDAMRVAGCRRRK